MSLFAIRYYIDSKFRCLLTRISPLLNTKYGYWLRLGRALDLKNPQTSNEKILWLKLNTYLNNPLVEQCADKCEVRKYVEQCGLKHILVTKLGEYDYAEDIDFDALPDKFVIKYNYGCGMNFICKDKSRLNISELLRVITKWKHSKYHLEWSEMQYAKMKRKYLIEEYLEQGNRGSLDDYKLYCCNGKPCFAMICTGRSINTRPKFYYIDRNGNLQRQLSKDGMEAPEQFHYDIPDCWEEMFTYAETLSKPFPFVRCDFYIVMNRVYFGELTFTPCAGMDGNKLPMADKLIGDLIQLPV